MLYEYEWDESKRIANLEKHEIDFWDIHSFEWDTAARFSSPRSGEMRWLAIGFIRGRLHCVIYTDRGNQRRIISLRKANSREERIYARAQAGSH